MITNFLFAEYKKTKLCCIRITEGKYDVIDIFTRTNFQSPKYMFNFQRMSETHLLCYGLATATLFSIFSFNLLFKLFIKVSKLKNLSACRYHTISYVYIKLTKPNGILLTYWKQQWKVLLT